MTFLLNTVAIDYITLTTFSTFDYSNVAGALHRRYDGGTEKARRMQYEGYTYKTTSGTAFWGIGMMGEREHHIISASGIMADEVSDLCRAWDFSRMSEDGQWNCSRIDIQLTMEADRLDAFNLRRALNGGLWPKRVPRKITLISSETDTIYIGSRASAVMWRIYQKTERAVRIELELKRDASKAMWLRIIDDCHNQNAMRELSRSVLLHEVRNLPDVSYIRPFRRALGSSDGVDVTTGERAKSTDDKKYAWLVSLIPTFQKMVNDDDYGHRVIEIFKLIIDNKSVD